MKVEKGKGKWLNEMRKREKIWIERKAMALEFDCGVPVYR